LAASLGRRYFAANHRRIRRDCDQKLPRCSHAETLEQSYFTSHNQSVDQVIEKKRELNRQFFEAGDPAAMNAFSTKLNRELAAWRASIRSSPECPRPPLDTAAPAQVPMATPSNEPVAEAAPCRLASSDRAPVMMFRQPEDFRALLAETQAGMGSVHVAAGFVARGGVKLESETPCALLGRQGTLMRVRVTRGPWEGTQGWIRADQISVDGEQ
jgi:hypothetical protein